MVLITNILLRRGGIWNLAFKHHGKISKLTEKFYVVFEQNSKSHLSAEGCLYYKSRICNKIWVKLLNWAIFEVELHKSCKRDFLLDSVIKWRSVIWAAPMPARLIKKFFCKSRGSQTVNNYFLRRGTTLSTSPINPGCVCSKQNLLLFYLNGDDHALI